MPPSSGWWDKGSEPALKSDEDAREASGLTAKINQVISAEQDDHLLSAPALAIGVDKTKVAFAELVWRKGRMLYRLAAGEVAFTATTQDIADPDTDPREAIYVLSVPAAGTVPTITKGTTAAAAAAVAPATPAGHVRLGTVKIQHNGSAIFDATSDNLDAAHLTVTYVSDAAYVVAAL